MAKAAVAIRRLAAARVFDLISISTVCLPE
jgi:hypothetical protein